ncbi:MAG: outer membrane protein assembly factor BamD [Sulfurimonas sp.]
MKIKTNFILVVLGVIVFFSGCSKKVEEYNKPALYWYAKIIESVSDGNFDKADNYYSSLQSEHAASPLLPEATMILAIAHMHYEEYLLSEHFLSEYIKRYANTNEKEFSEFMKIKSKYMALPNPRRDQSLISEAITASQNFKRNYPHSMYYPVVDTMATNLYMAQAVLNETIASLYDRVDKPKAAAYYRAITPQPWINWEEVDRANTSWYRAWFEGDGTASWYGFLVPDTVSVVSRHSITNDISNDDNKTLNK